MLAKVCRMTLQHSEATDSFSPRLEVQRLVVRIDPAGKCDSSEARAMIQNIGLVVLGCVVGFVLSGWAIVRSKRQYETVRRQLANLRGENYGEQVSTISAMTLPQTASFTTSTRGSADATGDEMERRCLELTDRIASLEQELDQARSVSTESVVPSTSTEGWQMTQLHREQIAMQIKLDEHVATIASLQQENKSLRDRLQL